MTEINIKRLAKEHNTYVACFFLAFFCETSSYVMKHFHSDLSIDKFLFLLVVN